MYLSSPYKCDLDLLDSISTAEYLSACEAVIPCLRCCQSFSHEVFYIPSLPQSLLCLSGCKLYILTGSTERHTRDQIVNLNVSQRLHPHTKRHCKHYRELRMTHSAGLVPNMAATHLDCQFVLSAFINECTHYYHTQSIQWLEHVSLNSG